MCVCVYIFAWDTVCVCVCVSTHVHNYTCAHPACAYWEPYAYLATWSAVRSHCESPCALSVPILWVVLNCEWLFLEISQLLYIHLKTCLWAGRHTCTVSDVAEVEVPPQIKEGWCFYIHMLVHVWYWGYSHEYPWPTSKCLGVHRLPLISLQLYYTGDCSLTG